MPVGNILYLGLVISAFATFAAVLTYAEWTTRHAAANTPRRASTRRNAPHGHDNEEPVSIRKAA